MFFRVFGGVFCVPNLQVSAQLDFTQLRNFYFCLYQEELTERTDLDSGRQVKP
jgi:hypothetical protein